MMTTVAPVSPAPCAHAHARERKKAFRFHELQRQNSNRINGAPKQESPPAKGSKKFKKQQSEERASLQAALGVAAEGDLDLQLPANNESSSEDECKTTDGEDPDPYYGRLISWFSLKLTLGLIEDYLGAFQQILTEAKAPGTFSGAQKYVRGPEVCMRTKLRRSKGAKELASAAKNTKSLLDMPGSFPLLVLWSAGDPTLAGNSLWSRKPVT